MGVGLDPGRRPNQHPWDATIGGVEPVEPIELVEAVDHRAAHADLAGPPQLGLALVVAVQDQPVGRDAGRQRDVQLAAGGHVEVHPLLVDQPCHGQAQERLGGVGHPVAEGGHGLAAPGAEVVLVIDEQRRTELGGQFGDRASADGQRPVGQDLGRVGQQAAGYRIRGPLETCRGFGGHGHQIRGRNPGPAAHIDSGAVTPRRSRPMARPMRVASTSHNRACVVPGGTPSPSTRQS